MMNPLKYKENQPVSPRRAAWTPERRAAQSARLRAARIWERSTRPRTAAGKSLSRLNALKSGQHTASRRMARATLSLQRKILRKIRITHAQMARYPHIDHTANRLSLLRNQRLTAILMPYILEDLQKRRSLGLAPG
jgi:hypothetical protein